MSHPCMWQAPPRHLQDVKKLLTYPLGMVAIATMLLAFNLEPGDDVIIEAVSVKPCGTSWIPQG